MSPSELVHALLRRWYVLVLAMVLTAAGAYHVLRPTQLYLGSAVVVLKPPVTGSQPNQLTNLQPGLATVSYAVIQQLESPAGTAELSAAGVHGTYRLVPRNSGTSATPRYLIPSLQVEAELTDPAAAARAVQQIINAYSAHLRDLQAAQGTPAASQITAYVLVPPSAGAMYGSKVRGLAGTALLGIVGGVLCALWTERYAQRRSSRRGGRGIPSNAILPA